MLLKMSAGQFVHELFENPFCIIYDKNIVANVTELNVTHEFYRKEEFIERKLSDKNTIPNFPN